MSGDHDNEGFLRRWSRVKSEARQSADSPPAAPAEALKAKAEEAPPELPPVEKLTLDSDYSGFFHPKVDEKLRRQALQKLFSDPHFNVMDGLDVYIDDYSKSEPIPAAMLASLKQAQRILEWAADNTGEHKEGGERVSATEIAAEPASDAARAVEIEDLRGEPLAGAAGEGVPPHVSELAEISHAKT